MGKLQRGAQSPDGSPDDVSRFRWSFALQGVPVRHTQLSKFNPVKGACGAHLNYISGTRPLTEIIASILTALVTALVGSILSIAIVAFPFQWHWNRILVVR